MLADLLLINTSSLRQKPILPYLFLFFCTLFPFLYTSLFSSLRWLLYSMALPASSAVGMVDQRWK